LDTSKIGQAFFETKHAGGGFKAASAAL